jgi:molybdopterin synthase sulfur carrier subunit
MSTAMGNSDLEKGLTRSGAGVITVLYFARLREALDRDREQLVLPADVKSVGALRDLLRARGGAWERELAAVKPVRVAVNQSMAGMDQAISAGDEIAFFPPVTGG